jgi:hypothetical protein
MNKLTAILILSLLGHVFGAPASAEGENRNPYRAQAATDISVSGNPGALIVNSAIAGFDPSWETDASTNYSISNDGATIKIIGSIDGAMPANTQLQINLTAPSGASSTGWRDLSASPSDLVTSIDVVDESGLIITYRLFAPAAAGIIASAQKTVTLTIAAQ